MMHLYNYPHHIQHQHSCGHYPLATIEGSKSSLNCTIKWITMEMIKLVISFLLLTNIFCLDGDKWTSQITYEKSDFIKDILTKMSGKPRPTQRFYNKKSAAGSLASRKRHRFHTFVGLMGKRS
ncbi:protachykinin-like [Hippocampus comes]|uniref:protachykinin-like n=1 Tax=Hippocampus comes TaxID=109280 RepID=UPI00094EB443|nr:PREDICTED: protachykinin-like [Hippocampus comes]